VTGADNLEAVLRAEVGRLRRRETRRVFDSGVHVGVLGGPHATFVARAQDVPALDAALRVDVVAALLDDALEEVRAADCGAWLTRPGRPAVHDEDLLWLAASQNAFGMHGITPAGFHALTRYGWLDVLTGERREWKRLRL
jgi:hypothetical protein